MTEYRVVLTDHAITDLKAISKSFRSKLHGDLNILQTSPHAHGKKIKRLKGFKPPIYRLRSGNYRVLYEIEENIVNVLRVINRKLLERAIKGLKL